MRTPTPRITWKPELGFRGARSVKPRLEPEDFVTFRPELDEPPGNLLRLPPNHPANKTAAK
jgi:hypothetical protein